MSEDSDHLRDSPTDPVAMPDTNVTQDGHSGTRPVDGSSSAAPLADSNSGSTPDVVSSAPIDDPTVISRRPPVHSARPDAPLGPRELGQTLVGRRLAHFQLMEFVGGGGMGAVFRATDTMLNRTVAVKVLSRDQGRDEETVRRFQNEAQSAARLDHENIARVYYVGEDDGWYFIVFEFIEGKNLRELVNEQGPMPLEQALQVTLQIAEALDHSAQREVVHRDIKPSNVLLTPTGKAKLVDMGLARLRPLQPRDEDLTASGVTLGTFDYISPEQARDPRMADVRSDLYSLGCTLYFMLTGQPPFPEGTVLQKLLSHSGEAAPDPRRLRPGLPPELVPLMNKMLAKKPTDRFARPVDLISDLLVLAERLGLATTTPGQAFWVTSEARPWQRWQFHLPWSIPVVTLLSLALFWDPTGIDQVSPDLIRPRFIRPAAAGPTPSNRDSAGRLDLSEAIAAFAEQRPGRTPASTSTSAPTTESTTEPTISRNNPVRDSSDQVASADRDTTVTGSEDRTRRTARPSDNNSASARTLVVDASPGLPRSAGELVVKDVAEACGLALQNSAITTIEIRQSGRLELSPLVLRLDDRQLKFVAAEDCSPVLSFRTGTSVSDYDSEGMIQASGGSLEFEGIHLEMTVPNETLDGEWSLFQLADACHLRIRNGSLIVHNSYGGRFSNLDNVAIFNCILPDRDDMLAPDMGQPREPIDVELSDCVIRCEATVLRAREALPIRLQWNNGLLITCERLASINGASQVPRDGERIELSLRHLTAVTDQGLADLSSSTARPSLMPIVIDSRDCIWSTQRWAPLITQNGPHNVTTLMNQLGFRGERNAYDGMESMWKITPIDNALVETFDFEMWRAHWREERPSWQPVPWLYALDKNRPIHEHRVTDFSLVAPKSTTSRGDTATEVSGFRAARLPQIPDPDRPRPRKTRPYFQF